MTLTIADLTSAKTLNNLNSSQLKQICGGFSLVSVAITNITQITQTQDAKVEGMGSIAIINMNGDVNLNP